MKTAKDFIIFPLDVSTLEEAKHYTELLSDKVGMFKVGLELFIRCGPDIVKMIKETGEAGIFLDLKLHDIPATVSRAMRIIGGLGVTFATVHCGESLQMLEAAVSGASGQVKVLGVTVLTSVSKQNIEAAGFRTDLVSDVSQLVLKRVEMAESSGCSGVVCSGREVSLIRKHVGDDFIIVTPGIRPEWSVVGSDDQQRITTPAEAIRNGSDYLVIGRPIRDAVDPANAVRRIEMEIESVL